ncbi:hypothetical protein O181_008784 [Austropuccinia psidii MF-1]|uniref:Uncharacterized protein n=1 Tax=Austropuccinia psidii MF-1 TaxID=1389203 RepID=A0A9Q3BPI9_9BASI|nr:hypothetical protein [Austropuccinia psidii MF-1]
MIDPWENSRKVPSEAQMLQPESPLRLDGNLSVEAWTPPSQTASKSWIIISSCLVILKGVLEKDPKIRLKSKRSIFVSALILAEPFLLSSNQPIIGALINHLVLWKPLSSLTK